jgi:hypothetical protein
MEIPRRTRVPLISLDHQPSKVRTTTEQNMVVYKYKRPWSMHTKVQNHSLSWWLFFCNFLLPTRQVWVSPVIFGIIWKQIEPTVLPLTRLGWLEFPLGCSQPSMASWTQIATHMLMLCVIAPKYICVVFWSRPICFCNCLAWFFIIDRFQIFFAEKMICLQNFPCLTFGGWLN